MDEVIDRFVAFLIKENCQGCTECEPRINPDFFPGHACKCEGEAKWFMAMASEFKEKEHGRTNDII